MWAGPANSSLPATRPSRVERLLDHGYDAVAANLPAVVSVVKEINEPRLPSFKAKLKAKKEVIPVWGLADLDLAGEAVGLAGSFTQVVKVFPPPPRGESQTWEGRASGTRRPRLGPVERIRKEIEFGGGPGGTRFPTLPQAPQPPITGRTGILPAPAQAGGLRSR